MKKLYINASPNGENSYSKVLGDYIDSKIVGETDFVDLIKSEVPFLTSESLGYHFGKLDYDGLSSESKIIADTQQNYINKLLEAEILIISTPMWNFGMPAILKAYFDLIIKPQSTFKIGENGFEGLVHNIKTAYVVGARGGIFKGEKSENMDNLSSETKKLLNFIGVNSVRQFWLEGTGVLSDNQLQDNLSNLKKEIDEVV
ncbi:FMN-dependent NADH-azoreductase [Candidatus Absconditicoccus praedator]|uniref:FMN-dependent NADH-azoreductase n=1 Tax=Candidatus Absconditicoccus praedator TaxID=2735562 RepID=UPI001E480889|nr:NAD(P)H-dependent oxidoreductase [Candidatus Absconditicoccus praedator]UFX82647.1 NAD(P)H-dependent oxidoreductase [Candidatus Absconditicoccus praedator]